MTSTTAAGDVAPARSDTGAGDTGADGGSAGADQAELATGDVIDLGEARTRRFGPSLAGDEDGTTSSSGSHGGNPDDRWSGTSPEHDGDDDAGDEEGVAGLHAGGGRRGVASPGQPDGGGSGTNEARADVGVALGYEWSRRRGQPLRLLELVRRHPVACRVMAGVCFWAVSTQVNLTYLGIPSPGPAVTKELLYAAGGLLLLAPVALAGGELPRSLRWLGTRVMVTLGVLSYGIYLWHEGVIDIYRDMRDYEAPNGSFLLMGSFPVMLTVVLLGTLAIAALSYVLVERPALSLKDRDLKLFTRWRPVGLPTDGHLTTTARPQLPPPSPAPQPSTTAATS